MFIAAVARPRQDRRTNQYFDGKIGIWPFVLKEPAQRNSKNRPKGTLITKPVMNINREQIKKKLLENIIPAIKERCPRSMKSEPIFIQQDNARPHLNADDEDLVWAGTDDGWDIRMSYQPPNSPDFNVLDLGFFSAIQNLQQQQTINTIDNLIAATVDAYNNFSAPKINNIFLTLQSCMEESMKAAGCNQYKIPHTNKEKLEREGRLPVSIICDPNVLAEAREAIDESLTFSL